MTISAEVWALLLPSMVISTLVEFKPFNVNGKDSRQSDAVTFFYAEIYEPEYPVIDFADIKFELSKHPCVMMAPSYSFVRDEMVLYATCDFSNIMRYKLTLSESARSWELIGNHDCGLTYIREFLMSREGINYTVSGFEEHHENAYVQLLQYKPGWNYDQIRAVHPIVNRTDLHKYDSRQCVCYNRSTTLNPMEIWHKKCSGSLYAPGLVLIAFGAWLSMFQSVNLKL